MLSLKKWQMAAALAVLVLLMLLKGACRELPGVIRRDIQACFHQPSVSVRDLLLDEGFHREDFSAAGLFFDG